MNHEGESKTDLLRCFGRAGFQCPFYVVGSQDRNDLRQLRSVIAGGAQFSSRRHFDQWRFA